MTDAQPARGTPWHLWAVGGLTLLWNAYGGYDYTMMQMADESYMAQFTAEQRAYSASFPVWQTTAWAVAVWGGVMGSILLLLRSGLAPIVYAIALLGLIVSYVYMYGMTDGARIGGEVGLIMGCAIGCIAIFETVYAFWLRGKGALR